MYPTKVIYYIIFCVYVYLVAYINKKYNTKEHKEQNVELKSLLP